jgi:hypothetical protein
LFSAKVICDPFRAEKELGWKARRSMEEIMDDAWRWDWMLMHFFLRWQSNNPYGYGESSASETDYILKLKKQESFGSPSFRLPAPAVL